MARVTKKLQVTVPKAIADQFGIRPGDELEFVPGDNSLRILVPSGGTKLTIEDRLRLFDQATQRQREREVWRRSQGGTATDRGWRREDLYTRGLPD